MPDILAFLQAAADTAASGYGRFPAIGGRAAVWIAAQIHLMFAAFVLGVPMFAVITELIGIVTKDSKYDKLSKEFTRLLVFAYSATALWGAISSYLFERWPSIVALALIQLMFSSLLYELTPWEWHHGFRVGPGYHSP